MQKKKRFDSFSSIGYDLLILFSGVSFLLERYAGWILLYVVAIITSFYNGIRHMIILINQDKVQEITDIPAILFSFIFATVLLIYPKLFYRFAIIFVGWWLLAEALIHLLRFYVKKRDQVSGAASLFASGFISLILSILFIFSKSISKGQLFSLIAGIYLIVYGLLGFTFHMFQNSKNKKKYHWSYSPPVLMNAFIPSNVYISIKHLKKASKLDIPKEQIHTPLHVYVYLNETGPEAFGHIDIGYKGTIYSYGCHDPSTRKLVGTMGDGVLIKSDEKLFIDNATHGENKVILSYGILLNESEEILLEKNIQNMMERTTPWLCPYAEAEKEGKDVSNIHDYASRVYIHTHAEMYKFTKGKFKTYFIAGTNCVNLADDLIRSKDLNLIDLNGLVTPGAYLAFLNTEYLKKDSIVKTRTLFESETLKNI